MHSMTESQTLQRGIDAAQVLENVAFKEAFQSLKDQITTQWRACPIRDKEGALLLLQLAKLGDMYEGILIGMVEAGKMSQRKIDMDKLRDETIPRRFFRKVAG